MMWDTDDARHRLERVQRQETEVSADLPQRREVHAAPRQRPPRFGLPSATGWRSSSQEAVMTRSVQGGRTGAASLWSRSPQR
jgi:hypothetical protein